ncbi:hypothetical protein R1flu_005106 [Riccia fluitans]|uniref:Uncharacterized protein n=1 Tax=Riccia fluitans TaxID=41844 RepID=A0ABD1YV78_9MARC
MSCSGSGILNLRENVHRSNSKSRSQSPTETTMQTKSNPGPRISKAGDMFSHNSRPNSILPKDDGNPSTADIHVQRAAVCCLASYCELEQARQLFQQQFRSLNFKRVYVSPLVVPDGTEEGNRQFNLRFNLAQLLNASNVTSPSKQYE